MLRLPWVLYTLTVIFNSAKGILILLPRTSNTQEGERSRGFYFWRNYCLLMVCIVVFYWSLPEVWGMKNNIDYLFSFSPWGVNWKSFGSLRHWCSDYRVFIYIEELPCRDISWYPFLILRRRISLMIILTYFLSNLSMMDTNVDMNIFIAKINWIFDS